MNAEDEQELIKDAMNSHRVEIFKNWGPFAYISQTVNGVLMRAVSVKVGRFSVQIQVSRIILMGKFTCLKNPPLKYLITGVCPSRGCIFSYSPGKPPEKCPVCNNPI